MSIVDGRIWPPYQAFYFESMRFNCRSAVRSIEIVSDTLDTLPAIPTHEDILKLPVQNILDELQNIVVQGAALSRYFWPVRKGHEARAAHLRELFDITEGNALQEHAKHLRDAIEHFDERLDRYLASGLVGYIFPEFIGIRPNVNDVPGHFFRAYFLDCGIFRLLGDEYLVPPIAEELLRLDARLELA